MRYTLNSGLQHELIIKKSRFLSWLEPVACQQEGLARVQSLRQQHPDAAHVCFCLLTDQQVRQSDDGEPSGTAAAPMLNVLQHHALDQVLAVVVRYFGGIKLGAGGLVRAYSQAISEPLKGVDCVPLQPWGKLQLVIGYEHESSARHLAESLNLSLEVSYASGVCLKLGGDAKALDELKEKLSDLTRGEMLEL